MQTRDQELAAAWYDGALTGAVARAVECQVRAEPEADRLTRLLMDTGPSDPPAPKDLRESVLQRFCAA